MKIKNMALALFSVVLAVPLLASGQQVVTLHGSISYSDLHAFKLVPFQVPEETHRLRVHVSYTTRDQKTVLDIGLLDPQRFRGWSGGDKDEFTISDVDATPSYLPGPLPAGTWNLLVGVPNIRKGVTAEFTATVTFSSSVDDRAHSIVLESTARWYQGDLHSHTGQSDGSCSSVRGKKVPCPVFKLTEAAEQQKLDFLAITDHNTVSTYNDLLELQPYYDNLLLIHGREITTYEGHMNAFDSAEFIDFRLRATVPTVNDVVNQAHKLGAIVSINHPAAPSGEICMGCGWINAATTDFSKVDAIEVANGPDAETRFSGIPFWQQRLNDGFRVTAIGGSDDHNSGTGKRNHVGTPTTVVYAKELSEAAIIDGIRAGHVFVKTLGPDGPSVTFSAIGQGHSAMMGDNVKAAAGDEISFRVEAGGTKPPVIEVIADGKAVPDFGSKNGVAKFTVTGDGERHWYRVNVRSADGKLLALTNPIYVNFAR
jgi:predicted metal-dependent phosphoesterase TrpH